MSCTFLGWKQDVIILTQLVSVYKSLLGNRNMTVGVVFVVGSAEGRGFLGRVALWLITSLGYLRNMWKPRSRYACEIVHIDTCSAGSCGRTRCASFAYAAPQ
jgi:hypothetical protein